MLKAKMKTMNWHIFQGQGQIKRSSFFVNVLDFLISKEVVDKDNSLMDLFHCIIFSLLFETYDIYE